MLELNEDNFQEEVLLYKYRPVFVDFFSEKYEICKELIPGIHELEKKYGDKIKFAILNTSSQRKLAIAQKVLVVPTMIIYISGEKSNSITSDRISTVEDVENFIREIYDNL